MAINPSTEFPGRITAPDANYTYGSVKNETSPGAGDGTPYILVRGNDIFGFQQALLRAASIVPNGNAETQLVSEYMQAIVELAAGRAITTDDSGVADAHVLTEQSGQQAPQSLYDGLICEFIPDNDNTGATTVDPFGLGVDDVFFQGAACVGGEILTTRKARIKYDLANARYNLELINEQAVETILGEAKIATQALVNAGANNTDIVTSLKLHSKPGLAVQEVYTQDSAVNSGSGTIAYDDNIPQNIDGDEYMTLAITPKSATNLLKIEVAANLASSVSDIPMIAALFQDSTADALAAVGQITSTSIIVSSPIPLTFWMVAGTTSATTFKLRAGTSSASTSTFNGVSTARRFGGVMASNMTITEYRV